MQSCVQSYVNFKSYYEKAATFCQCGYGITRTYSVRLIIKNDYQILEDNRENADGRCYLYSEKESYKSGLGQ